MHEFMAKDVTSVCINISLRLSLVISIPLIHVPLLLVHTLIIVYLMKLSLYIVCMLTDIWFNVQIKLPRLRKKSRFLIFLISTENRIKSRTFCLNASRTPHECFFHKGNVVFFVFFNSASGKTETVLNWLLDVVFMYIYAAGTEKRNCIDEQELSPCCYLENTASHTH